MKQTLGAILLLSIASGLACTQPAAEPPTAAGGPVAEPLAAAPAEVPLAMAKVIEERNQLHKRQHGALLTITARWEKDPRFEPAVWVYWSIDYDGPRRPFTILTPGMGTDGVRAHFWYTNPDGTAVAFVMGLRGRVRGG